MKPQRSVITITDRPGGGVLVSCTFKPRFNRGCVTPGISLVLALMKAMGAPTVLGEALTKFALAKPEKRKRKR